MKHSACVKSYQHTRRDKCSSVADQSSTRISSIALPVQPFVPHDQLFNNRQQYKPGRDVPSGKTPYLIDTWASAHQRQRSIKPAAIREIVETLGRLGCNLSRVLSHQSSWVARKLFPRIRNWRVASRVGLHLALLAAGHRR